ncbi:MAG TPA: GNAT family N-acetyltransferase [Thermotogota bacterium]|nr:GNAT family N-acetyltransferase [Thermotogota bacterium]HRW93293.1 GNAT family N-acetyltransferase [Thermotogota bacterium]
MALTTREIFEKLDILTTPRLILRPMKESDAPDMFAYASNPEVTRYTLWETHRSLEDAQVFLQGQEFSQKEGLVHNWAIVWKEQNRMIGTGGFIWWKIPHRSAEIGYALSQDFWGRGIMSEAMQAVLHFGFTRMQLNRIQAHCLVDNLGSERVMQKIGMRFEGVSRQEVFSKGQFRDLKRYAILKSDWDSEKGGQR